MVIGWRLILAGWALSAGLYSLYLFREDILAAYSIVAAGRLERGQQLDGKSLGQLVYGPKFEVFERSCRSDLMRAGLTLTLANADAVNQSTDYEAWSVAVDRADRFARHYVTCLPADGNGWFRMAVISRAVAENSKQLAELLANSVRFAPAERPILQARLLFYRTLSERTLSAAIRSLRADITTTLTYGSKEDLKLLLEAPLGKIRSEQEALRQKLPQDRLAYIERFEASLAKNSAR